MLCIRLLCIKPIDETRVDANYLCKFSKIKKNMYNIQYYQDHAVWYGILCDLNATNCRSAACKQISVQCAGHFLRSMVWSPTFTSSCHFLQWIQCSSDSSEYWAFEWNGNTLRVYNRFLDGRHSPPGQLNLFILWIMQKKTLQNRAGKKTSLPHNLKIPQFKNLHFPNASCLHLGCLSCLMWPESWSWRQGAYSLSLPPPPQKGKFAQGLHPVVCSADGKPLNRQCIFFLKARLHVRTTPTPWIIAPYMYIIG